jgi:hypothetical protein
MKIILVIIVVLVVFAIMYWFAVRPWHIRWGATDTEIRMRLPGDDIVSSPVTSSTRAITINTSADHVWPWLVQMGQGRGGLYSYETLENLAGCDIHNANRVIPEFQNLQVGDKFRLGPEGYPYYRVTGIEPQHALVLGDDRSKPTGVAQSWVFVIEKIDENHTRLISRTLGSFAPSAGNFIIWQVITEPLAFIMEHRMLHGIKERAEGLTLQGS